MCVEIDDVVAPAKRLGRVLCVASIVLSALASGAAAEEQVVCHYTYGGETRRFSVAPTDSAYSVDSIAIGSYFRFRVVFQNRPADLAAIKVYTYADRDEGAVLIHQATYPYPPAMGTKGAYGFSGLHFVYEPVRDGELQYWCEWSSGQYPGKYSGRTSRREERK